MKIESLRAYLLIWLLVPLGGVALVNVFNSYQAAGNTAKMVSDRTLVASATTIAEEVTVIDGVIESQAPPAAIEMFNTGHGDLVFYSVQTRNGQLLDGYPNLPRPEDIASSTHPIHYWGSYHGHPLRLVALTHPVIGADEANPVTVVVGQTLYAHREMVRDLLLRSIVQQLALLVATAILILFAFRRGLAPIMRLRDAVLDDKNDVLEPLPVNAVQTELRPLVAALNTYKHRMHLQMAAQHRFVANAAHQIKTPLTLLATQAAFAQRAKNKGDREEALAALQRSVQQFAHMVNQLLTLSRAEPGARRPRHEQIDLTILARGVLETFTNVALERKIDLGFDPGDIALMISGDETMMREMVVNLVDNALRYTPMGGMVTVTMRNGTGNCLLRVTDNGPGIPPEERSRVFERFYRVIGNGGEGSGLGLAIVFEVITAAGGSITLGTPDSGKGLAVEVTLPAAIEAA
jgi:two-component system sensor histidine kinase TctE